MPLDADPSAPRRVRNHLGADVPELLKHRFGSSDVFRPVA